MHTTQQMEDLHISYIAALCAASGVSYDIQRHDDDSTDGIIKKRIILGEGLFCDSSVRIQLKSTASASQYEDKGDHIRYRLRVKNYNDLCMRATTPIILGLLILPEDDSEWVRWSTEELLIKGCMYWAEFSGEEKEDKDSSVYVRIPKENIFNRETMLNILEKIAKEEWP